MATVKQILAMSASERDALNQSILATLTNVPHAAAQAHAPMLKAWSTKLCGPKPTPEMVVFNNIIDGGRRVRPNDETVWLAMTLRPNGATVGEYMCATKAGGAAHNNAAKYNTERGGTGWLVRVPLPNDTRAGRWQHVITDKGAAQLAKRVAALTGTAETKKPAPVKASRKGNAKPAPVSEPVPADTVPVEPAEQPSADQLAALAAQFNS